MKGLKSSLKFLFKYTKGNKRNFILVVLISIVSITLNILIPIISAKQLVYLTQNNLDSLFNVTVLLMVLVCGSTTVWILYRMLYNFIYYGTYYNLCTTLARDILRIETKVMDESGSGLFIQRLMDDTSKVSSKVTTILEAISNILKQLGVFIAIFIISPLVFGVVLFFKTIEFILESKNEELEKKDDKVCRAAKEKVTSMISELVRGSSDIKMLNSEPSFLNEYDSRIKEANRTELKKYNCKWGRRLFTWNIWNVFDCLQMILIIYLLKYNVLSSVVAVILYNYIDRLESSIYFISELLESVVDLNLSVERIKDIMEGDKFKKESFGTKHIDKVNGDFEFKNVSFKYDKNLVLNNINFKINANETVAFVGKSGAGKTTIFNLLTKLYDVKSGTITIDGINIKELDKDSIRGNITIISQNPYIFNMSIKDNLKIVKPDITMKEIKEVCKIACLDEFIDSLPDKYNTVIGEGGVNLSGGQKQRLAIARALIQKTEIILFDEATSALDNETQTKITEAINNMKGEYTILIVAHRLSTIKNANKIFFINDGKVEKEGTFDELMKKCKGFKELYESEIIK